MRGPRWSCSTPWTTTWHRWNASLVRSCPISEWAYSHRVDTAPQRDVPTVDTLRMPPHDGRWELLWVPVEPRTSRRLLMALVARTSSALSRRYVSPRRWLLAVPGR